MMGEVAEMMLDGTLCQHCGVYDDHDDLGGGFPWCCPSCAPDGDCGMCKFWTETRAKGYR